MSAAIAQSVNTVKQISRVPSSREAASTRTTNARPQPSFLRTLLRTLSAFAA